MKRKIEKIKLDLKNELLLRIEDLKMSKNTGPLVVEIAPTFGCNHNCIHCGFQQYSSYANKKRFLPLKQYKEFVDDFTTLGGKEIWFAGNGEPFLNPNFSEMVKYAANKGLSIGISSNTVPATQKKIKDTIENISWTKFSLNGATPDTYSKVHRCEPKDFFRAVDNIKLFSSYSKKSIQKPLISIQYLIMRDNWDEIEQMVMLHKVMGFDQLIFRNVTRKEHDLVQIPDNIKKILTKVDNADDVIIDWNSFDKKPVSDWNTCYGINFRINLSENGDLYTCCRNLVIPSVYGNILENRFYDIWHSPQKDHLFQDIYNFKDRKCCLKWCQCASDNKIINEQMIH